MRLIHKGVGRMNGEFIIYLLIFTMGGLLEAVKGHPLFKVVFAIVYLTSGTIICILQASLWVTVGSWNMRLYRKINYCLNCSILYHILFLTEWWANTDCELFADPEDMRKYIGQEPAFVIINHGKDIEPFLICGIGQHFKTLGNLGVIMKKAIAYIPVYGWSWVMQGMVFIERNWERDRKTLRWKLRSFANGDDPTWVILLPEGTRFNDEKHEMSRRVAREKGLPELNYVLLPRTKGFVAGVNDLRGKVPAVYDVTPVVEKGFEENASFAGLAKGKKLSYKIMLRRFPMNELPEDEKELANWLHKLYQEKDKLVGNVLNTGEYEPDNGSLSTTEMKTRHQHYKYFTIPRKVYSLLNIVSWAVVILGLLVYYLYLICKQGNYVQFGIIIATMWMASIVLDKLIDLTKASKSSSYGKSRVSTKLK